MTNPLRGCSLRIRIGISVTLSLLLGFLAWGIYSQEPDLEPRIPRVDQPSSAALDWQSQDSDPSLPHLARLTLEHYFMHGTLPAFTDQDLQIPAEWQQSAGLFVTLSRQGKQRGCWGTLVPSARNLATATMKAAIGAATRDWRYPPLQAWELPTASIQVAIVKSFVPIESMQQVDPVHQGLFLRSGPRGAVLLPGEALTSEWQLATAQHLAGIPAGEKAELFRVDVEMLHEFR